MSSGRSDFPSTHWSLIESARGENEAEARQALENLCERYWYPIYAYLRRSGRTPADAEDLTQSFFQRVVLEKAFHSADQAQGRLRSYLLGVMKRLLSDDKRHREAAKRGGKLQLLSFDDAEAESRYQLEPADTGSPDHFFDRTWARSVLVDASGRLRELFREGGNAESYEHLSEFLPLGENARSYREVAARMGVDEKVVRLQVHRMRQRYRVLIEETVALTVRDPAEVDDELSYLMSAIGGP